MTLAGLLIVPCCARVTEAGSNLGVANVAGITNSDFELGTAGEPPPGWYVPKALKAQGFSAILTTNQPNHGNQCAEIRWPCDRKPSASQFANLMQSVDATPWRNPRIKVTPAIQKCRPLNREKIGMFRSNLSPDEKKAKLKELEQRMILLMGKEDRQLYEKLQGRTHADSEFGMVQVQSAWMQFMLRYDPVVDFQRLKCPVLALNGQLDRQVLASQNLPAIGKNLKAGGNAWFTTKELSGLNHLLQSAKIGDLKEYGEIEETFSPAGLSKILTWLTAYAKSPVSGQTQRARSAGL